MTQAVTAGSIQCSNVLCSRSLGCCRINHSAPDAANPVTSRVMIVRRLTSKFKYNPGNWIEYSLRGKLTNRASTYARRMIADSTLNRSASGR